MTWAREVSATPLFFAPGTILGLRDIYLLVSGFLYNFKNYRGLQRTLFFMYVVSIDISYIEIETVPLDKAHTFKEKGQTRLYKV